MDRYRLQKTDDEGDSGAVMSGNMIMVFGDAAVPVAAAVIHERPNCHGKLSAVILTDNRMREYILYEGNGWVSLYYIRGGEMHPLFQGIVMGMETSSTGETCMVEVKAKTATCQMDIEKYNLSYQDTAMTFHQMVRKLLGFFPGGQALISVPDRPVGQISMQYQETFWEFLKRLVSAQRAFVYADSAGTGLRLWVGLPGIHEQADWDSLPYTVERDTAPRDPGLTLKGQIRYHVESYDILALGTGILFHNQELYIGDVRRRLRNGLLVSEYGLYYKEGLQPRQYYNPLLNGVSINGSVEDVKRDRLKVRLETDALQACQNQYYYPFSTVAASPDGSGWYCMPRAGDRVRIFFPESDEKQGYAIANIQGNSAPEAGSPMENPNVKDITTPDGNSVKFLENGILLTVDGAKGSVTLTNDGKAEVNSEQAVLIGAAAEIRAETDGELELSAGEEVRFNSDGGADMSVKGDTVEIHAAFILNNC